PDRRTRLRSPSARGRRPTAPPPEPRDPPDSPRRSTECQTVKLCSPRGRRSSQVRLEGQCSFIGTRGVSNTTKVGRWFGLTGTRSRPRIGATSISPDASKQDWYALPPE